MAKPTLTWHKEDPSKLKGEAAKFWAQIEKAHGALDKAQSAFKSVVIEEARKAGMLTASETLKFGFRASPWDDSLALSLAKAPIAKAPNTEGALFTK